MQGCHAITINISLLYYKRGLVFFFCRLFVCTVNNVLSEETRKIKGDKMKSKMYEGTIIIESSKMKRVRSIFKT